MSDAFAWVSTVIAAVSAVVAVWQAIGASRSRAAASKSAKDAASAATRISEALTTLSRLVEEDAARVEAPWEIERVNSHLFRVVNGGAETCREVEVTPVGSPYRFNGHGVADVHRNAGKEFFFQGRTGMDESDWKVRVTWHLDRHPDRLEWFGDVPRGTQR